MANKLLDKLKKNSTVSLTSVLTESSLFNSKDVIQTPIPALNIALSGHIEGGFVSGITTLAAPSKHFKSLFSLIMAKSYMDKYPDSIMLFYDSEFGTPEAYFNSLNIDMTRVLHTPILNVEELKFDITSQLDNIQKGEKVIIVIDSLGNLASKKEIDDALDGKSVADMSRAKQFKSLFRIITPHLIVKDIPCLVVNHTYKEMCLDGDTLIKTENGLTPIKNIQVGDLVYAQTGLQKVLATYTPEQLDTTGKDFLELEFEDGSVVKCTHDHKFLIDTGEWVEAEDLIIGQEMW